MDDPRHAVPFLKGYSKWNPTLDEQAWIGQAHFKWERPVERKGLKHEKDDFGRLAHGGLSDPRKAASNSRLWALSPRVSAGQKRGTTRLHSLDS